MHKKKAMCIGCLTETTFTYPDDTPEMIKESYKNTDKVLCVSCCRVNPGNQDTFIS